MRTLDLYKAPIFYCVRMMNMDYFSKPWLKPVEPVQADEIVAEYEADVVIMGAGHAGTAAARAAWEAGASVIVVELGQEKSFSVFGAQYGSINSKFAQAQGVEAYDPVDIISDWQKRSLNRANPELIRKFAYSNGDTFDWFIEPLSQKIKDNIRIFMNPKPKYFDGELHGYKNFVGTAIFTATKLPAWMEKPKPEHTGEEKPEDDIAPKRFQSLTEAVVETHQMLKKGGVQFFYGISGEQVEKNAEGRVVALIGRNHLKQVYRFKAKNGVILAAGDFSGDKKMVMDLLPEYADLTDEGRRSAFIPNGRNGAGIKIGLRAGGIMEPGPRGGMWACVSGNGGPMDGAAFLRLNAEGKRYTNEGFMGYWGSGLQGARQADGNLVTIWDANWRDELEYQSLDHSAVDVSDEELMENLTKLMEKMARTGEEQLYRPNGPPAAFPKGAMNRLVVADTISELADKLGYQGIKKENFMRSIERYNKMCVQGRDEDFAKSPKLLHPVEKAPFYAFQECVPAAGFLMVTVSGLWVDGDQKVLDKDLKPIPGLYATGNCSGGRFPGMYTTPVAGVSIGICYALGRIVGDYVARNGIVVNPLFM